MRDDPTMVSTYQTLVDYLIAHTDADEIMLAFSEIEVILGVPLSVTMPIDASAGNSAHHADVRVWQAARWVATLDRRHRGVCFTRDGVGG